MRRFSIALRLRGVERLSDTEVYRIAAAIVRVVARVAVQATPVDTGRLARSFRSEWDIRGNLLTADFSWNTDYAQYVRALDRAQSAAERTARRLGSRNYGSGGLASLTALLAAGAAAFAAGVQQQTAEP